MLEAVPQTRGASNIVVEGKADYTLQELNEASNKSVEVWKELDLDFVAVDEEYNALIVGAYEWTEEKKQTFYRSSRNTKCYISNSRPIRRTTDRICNRRK